MNFSCVSLDDDDDDVHIAEAEAEVKTEHQLHYYYDIHESALKVRNLSRKSKGVECEMWH